MKEKSKETKKKSEKYTFSKGTPGYFEEIRSKKGKEVKDRLTKEDLANVGGE